VHQAILSVLGADISSLNKSEALGGIYRTEKGKQRDALRILRSGGLNWARLRVWVDPADGHHDKDELLQMAKRIKQSEMRLLVNLHYSDTWADPAHQTKPAAWKDYAFGELKQAVYDHTYDVCYSLKEQRTLPAMVQIGNELNAGMLWPEPASMIALIFPPRTTSAAIGRGAASAATMSSRVPPRMTRSATGRGV